MDPVLQRGPDLLPVLDRIATRGVNFDRRRLARAYEVAKEVYADDTHWTGTSLISHVFGVLDVLLPFEPDEDAVVACLLHHTLHTKRYSLSELESEFGPKVRSLVSAVHLLSHVTLEGRRSSIEDLRLMLLNVSEDVRTVLISLCDLAYVLRFVGSMQQAEARQLCKDALQVFAPVAARLGIYSLKHEIENGAFPVLYQSDAERIKEQLQNIHAQRGRFLLKAAEELQEHLNQQGINAEVQYREKLPYSIFTKMHAKSLSYIEDLYDLFAIRIVVDSLEDCYRVLGLIHRRARPVAHRFKDYISFPKPNGYQSLHTTLLQMPNVPEHTFVEVQIRTKNMHREAEYGVAAHWGYKEHGSTARAVEKVQLHEVLASHHFIEEKEDRESFVDHIFVLSPKGDIVELPEGATPLDFAFQVHTNLGLAFHAARVNGSIVSMDYQLENGDIVEIIKRGTPHPSPQWLQLLRMASSRSKLRRYLNTQDRPEYIALGRTMLNEELRKHGLPQLDQDLSVLRKYQGSTLNLSQREDLLVKIGHGAQRVSSVLAGLDDVRIEPLQQQQKQEAGRMQRKDAIIEMDGGIAMPMRYAKCCKPQEGTHVPLLGIINRYGEVMVHRARCGNIRNSNPERQVSVRWR